ncbi:PQQ-dependent sugar dehydrogenase [Methylophaga sulfidovorans]|uniref:Glucose/arabinose dehydrogenase, beta-propeller fold n=1 Tax=Methylophaga sulfidovorans TaxID=45496 RepID=A0A1I4BN20_9GAMM|nr:PQQ-dependent sugar dehydrogenase [Methylophaga sulfidovorans]SFK70252.1 Glucose/arabinose dehydrogenase, beta-propeller fold [Methylophaga sulfidovorans]
MILKTMTQLILAGTLGLTAQATLADRADAEENLHKLKLPAGFHIDVYAEVEGARQMALGQSTGTVFVGTRGNNVFAVVDKNKDRKADKVVKILDDLKVGNGVAMHQGNLYVAEQNRIAIYPAPGFDLNLPFKQMREVIYDKLPDKAHHGWRYITFGPDNKLYVTVGAPCNICNPQGIEGSIIRMNADGSDAEVYAKGIRNSVGMDFQPDTGTLYFTDNNVDMLGDDNPPGELNAAPKAGMHFGFPYYAGGKAQHPDWKGKKAPQKVTFPVEEFQAHTANLGFKFYTGDMFPADYKGDAIIAQHGSWNRTSPVGYQLMRVTFDDNHQVTGQEVFIDGWLQNGEAWGRPTDVLQLSDGSLLISDDYNDVIYRVSYGDDKAPIKTVSSPSNNKTITDLIMPESAIAAPDGRVFITEIGEFGKAGDGKVTVIDKSGQKATLATDLNDPKGIDLWNNELYIADVDHVVKVDMNGKVTVAADTKAFPGKPVFLNDMEIDGNGTLYVSDSGNDDGENAGIYQITQAGKVSEILSDSSAIKRPNGLLMDGNDSLLVADFGTGDLYRMSISTGKTEALNKGFGGADGLVRDSKGYLYVSDWQNGKVWQLVEPKATPQLISDDFVSAADISLSADGQSIMVPDMKGGKLVYLPIQ